MTVVSCHHQLSETAIDAYSLGGMYHPTLTDASLLAAEALATIGPLLSFCHQMWRDAGGSWSRAGNYSCCWQSSVSSLSAHLATATIQGVLYSALVYRTHCTIPLSRRSTLLDGWPSPVCAGRRGLIIITSSSWCFLITMILTRMDRFVVKRKRLVKLFICLLTC